MIHSKRSSEGVIYVNHKDSPGISNETLGKIAQAFPGEDTLPPGAGVGMFEAPMVSCSHCQAMVIIDPTRTRQRGWCGKCAHYICDKCALNQKLGLQCKPYTQVVDEYLESVIKEQQWNEIKNRE